MFFFALYYFFKGKKSSAEDVVAHFKCENNQTLNDSLMIPITNGLKEQALRIAAKQRMSEKEKQRRKLTGRFGKKHSCI